MRLTIASAAALLTCIATPAMAQDSSRATADGSGVKVFVYTGLDRVTSKTGLKDSGIAYIGSIGYDFNIGDITAGVEAEAGDSSAESCGGGACLRSGRDLYVGGRLGVAHPGTAMIYIKAGYTNARVDATLGAVSAHQNLDGVRVGAGIEVGNGPLRGRIEYRYSNYEQDVVRHQLLAGLGFRF